MADPANAVPYCDRVTAHCPRTPPPHQVTPLPLTSELAERLLARGPELSVLLRDTLVGKDEVYATTGLVPPDELLRSCRDNMMRCLQSLSGRVPEGEDLLDAARTTARNRAEAGFPLDSLLHAYRLGTEILWAALLDEARTHAPEVLDELLDSAVQVMQLVDVMSMAAADEYRTREMEIDRRDTERRQAVLDSLLAGGGVDPDVAAEAMQVLGLPEEARLAVVVVGTLPAASSRSMSPRDALETLGFRSEWRLRSDREVGLVLLGSAPVERLAERLRSMVPGRAAVSGTVVGVAEVISALRMAELAFASIPDGSGSTVVTFEDRLPEALLEATPLVAPRLRECAFGRLLELEVDRRRVLLDTLDCWFRNNRSAAGVGKELHCHRNTVLHRLNRVEALSGRRLADSRDELLLRLALLVRAGD